ncbi:MAG: KUP/HAK/KT family potassium transporter, partial [Bdellovibrionaceae bacterium]|nr:KUP/HAK/KT family potassium transporter [Pseudobdellovibrionaceae bacterium]
MFGDIGTSPLYAIREAFAHELAATAENVLGILSLVIWTMTLIVSFKYLVLVLRADNKGEGGVLALTALISSLSKQPRTSNTMRPLILVGIFGAALLFGDGMITPAVTILGAVEGLSVATPLFDPFVVPISITILVVLFWAQHFGTARIGSVFGPVILIWFISIAALGIGGIIESPVVLEAFNPLYALQFLFDHNMQSFYVLGAVFLTATGAEALYADIGHFGPTAIRKAWYFVAFPCLLTNYLGQGALLLAEPEAVSNPFFHLVPSYLLYPMVLLSSMAAIIASQALITGVFSVTQQAVHLGYLPRLPVVHTSDETIGQIYVPHINWILMSLTIWLVITFRSSTALASAYGIAVSMTMIITTVLTCIVAKRLWGWNVITLGVIFFGLLVVDAVFLSANFLKIHEGGWFPLAVGALVFMVMTTWKKGRLILFEQLKTMSISFEAFMEQVRINPPARVKGTAIFMSIEQSNVPVAIMHNLKHNKVLHERNIFLTVATDKVPYVRSSTRLEVSHLGYGFYRLIAHYGFMERPDING